MDASQPRRLPVGIQSFEKIREGRYLYVDKTAYIWRLVNEGTVYFLSRPRRFGKSLLTSTLDAYFRGKRDLFQGLAIEQLEASRGEDAWTEHPVIHLDLSAGDYSEADGLRRTLRRIVHDTAQSYDVEDDENDADLPGRFIHLIERLHAKTGRQVVVLVDEYDKPLLDVIESDPAQEERNRATLQSFFGTIKVMDAHLTFVFFTGVTKFTKVSVFSGLNNLRDISLEGGYANICGITQTELEATFTPEIDTLANAQGLTRAECLDQLAYMYDGYHFATETLGGEGVYNPFSLLRAFLACDFGSYWYETGTFTALPRILRETGYTPEELNSRDDVTVFKQDLSDYTTDDPDPTPLLYQAGYLTLSGYDQANRACFLTFPNEEVRRGFLDKLAPSIIGGEGRNRSRSLYQITRSMDMGDVDGFMTQLTALFASIPYEEGGTPEFEVQWRDRLFIVFMMLGMSVRSEVHTATGRADCVVESKQFVYIFEFKLDHTAGEALAQIEEKGYATPYKADRRRVVKIGVNFSTEKRTIAEWKVA